MNKSYRHQLQRAKNRNTSHKEEIIMHFKNSSKYKKYDELFLGANFEKLLECRLNNAAREAIENKYQSDQSKILKPAIVKRYKDINLPATTCAYCGTTQDVKNLQLDHVLPKVTFKDLAIYKRNLVLSCSSCNGSWAQNYVNNDGKVKYHRFLHEITRVVEYKMDILEGEVIIKYVDLKIETEDNVDVDRLKSMTRKTDLSLTNMSDYILAIQEDYDSNGLEGVAMWLSEKERDLRRPSTNEHVKVVINAVKKYLDDVVNL